MPNMQSPDLHHQSHAASVKNLSILDKLANNIDLVMTLAEVMTEMQAYASMATLAEVNREYHTLLGPFLKKTKARIVIELSDLDVLSQARYKEIEIVECSAGSRISIQGRQMEEAVGLSRKAAGLRPWLLTFRGEPKKYLPDVQGRLFPDIEVVRVVHKAQQRTMDESDGCNHCSPNVCEDGWSGAAFDYYCSTFFNSSRYTARYASTFRYYASGVSRSRLAEAPKDRIRYELDMTSITGNKWQFRRDTSIPVTTTNDLLHHGFWHSEWDSAYLEDLHLDGFEKMVQQVHIKTYFFIRPGACIHHTFSRVDNAIFCGGMEEFDSKLREMAEACLDMQGQEAGFTFELFAHHGNEAWAARQDMEPVISKSFSTNEDGRVVMCCSQMSEEFLGCSKNNGCGRCRA